MHGTLSKLCHLVNIDINSVELSGFATRELVEKIQNLMRARLVFLSGLLIKSGSESSLSEEDELKQGDSGSKEAQTQGEEKESCSDEEEKSKENTDAEGEQSTNTGNTFRQKNQWHNHKLRT